MWRLKKDWIVNVFDEYGKLETFTLSNITERSAMVTVVDILKEKYGNKLLRWELMESGDWKSRES